MITCLTCSLPGVVLSTKTQEFKVFFHAFEQHRYGMNEGLNGGGPLVGCRLKFSHFVGSRLTFFDLCRLSVNLS